MARKISPQNQAFSNMLFDYLKKENIGVPELTARLIETQLIKMDAQRLSDRIGDWKRGKGKPEEGNIKDALRLVLGAHNSAYDIYNIHAKALKVGKETCLKLSEKYKPNESAKQKIETWTYIFSNENILSPLVQKQKDELLSDIRQETLRDNPLVPLEVSDEIGSLKFVKTLLWLYKTENQQLLLPEEKRTRMSDELGLVAKSHGIVDKVLSEFVEPLLDPSVTAADVTEIIYSCLPLIPYNKNLSREDAVELRNILVSGNLKKKLVATLNAISWLTYSLEDDELERINIFFDVIIENTFKDFPLNEISIYVVSQFAIMHKNYVQAYKFSAQQFEQVLSLSKRPDLSELFKLNILRIFSHQTLDDFPFPQAQSPFVLYAKWAHIADLNIARRHIHNPKSILITTTSEHLEKGEHSPALDFCIEASNSANPSQLKEEAALCLCRMGYWSDSLIADLINRYDKANWVFEKHELIALLSRKCPDTFIPILLDELLDDTLSEAMDLRLNRYMAIIGCGSTRDLERLFEIAIEENSSYLISVIYAAMTSEQMKSTVSFLKTFPWWKTNLTRRLTWRAFAARNVKAVEFFV